MDCFAVARLKEASDLRAGGIDTPIALLGGVFSEANLNEALNLDLQLGVHTESQVKWLEKSGQGNATVWLKIDTGMNRLGFRMDDATEMIDRLHNSAAVADLRVMTHFANADDVHDLRTRNQIAEFGNVLSKFEGDISIANSPGILGWQKNLQEFAGQFPNHRLWVRPGLSLYGVSPFADRTGAELGLRPAMQFQSRLIAIKPLRKGDLVGYGGTWQAQEDTVLGIVAAGYGDGYTRFIPAGSPVLVNGRRVKIAGLVSMDLSAVDLGPGAADEIGDPVLLWGDELPVEEVARHAGTIPYELLCGVSNREDPEFED